ncbi:MAG: transglycosylase family protein [Acidimicrobiia bacterium]
MRESPARAEPHDATTWLPLPDFAELPPLDRLLVPDPDVEPAAPREVPVGLPSPARAEPHDATAWLPLPQVEELPSVDTLLVPDPTVAPTAPREVPVGLPSPARAEPHDATAWLPLPEFDPEPAASGDQGGPPRGRPRRARRFHFPTRAVLTSLAVVATMGGAFLGVRTLLDKGADVDVRVDGRLIAAETGVDTVGDLLVEQNVALGEFDRTTPDASTPIDNNMTVRVLRAFAVPVNFDGTLGEVQTTYRHADGFLEDATAQLNAGGAALGVLDAPNRIDESTAVAVRTRKTGVLVVDSEFIEYDAPVHTVAELLAAYDVKLDDIDTTSPYGVADVLPAVAADGDKVAIAVNRNRNETEAVDEVYSLPDQMFPDPNVAVTAPNRVVRGKPGVHTVTYLIIRQNGVVTGRVATGAVDVEPAVPTITYYGVKYDSRWDKIAECETGRYGPSHPKAGELKWDIIKPVYQGALGIWYDNWSALKDKGWAKNAGHATKYQQIIVAERILAEHGWGAWGCAKTLGYTKDDGKRQF